MGFDEVQFPTDISYGSKGGPGFDTAIVAVDSRFEQRNSRRAAALHVYDVGYGVKSWSALATLRAFYYARSGALNGFRYKDWLDFASTANHQTRPTAPAFGDQSIGTGDGSTTMFQLVKRYTNGGRTHVRNITKPVSGTVLIGVNGSNVASGWSVNTTTGIVTFSSAPANGDTITAGFEFDVPARFGDDLDKRLDVSVDDYDDGSIRGIIVQELPSETPVNDDLPRLGAKNFGAITADQSITVLDGTVLTFSPSSARNVTLPTYVNAAKGGPYFVIVNAGSATITLKDHTGATVASIVAGTMVNVFLGFDNTGSSAWYAV